MIITNVYGVILDPKNESEIIKRLEMDELKEGWQKIYESEMFVTFELRKACEIPSILLKSYEGEKE